MAQALDVPFLKYGDDTELGYSAANVTDHGDAVSFDAFAGTEELGHRVAHPS